MHCLKNILIIESLLVFISVLSGCGFRRDQSEKKSPDSGNKIANANKPAEAPDPNTGTSISFVKGPQASPLGLHGALISFDSCAAVEAHIENHMIEGMRQHFLEEIRYLEDGYGDETYSNRPTKAVAKQSKASDDEWISDENDMVSDEEVEETKNDSPIHVTTTNNQVDGVEESDVIKNNGQHIFQINRNALQIMKSWPANELSLKSETKLKGLPLELLLDHSGQRLVVISKAENSGDAELNGHASPMSKSNVSKSKKKYRSKYSSDIVEVTIFDVSDTAKPAKLQSYQLKGRFHSARRVDQSVRIILQSELRQPDDLNYGVDEKVYSDGYPEDYDSEEVELQLQQTKYREKPKLVKIAALHQLMKTNEALIRARSLSAWLDADAFVKLDQAGVKTPLLDLSQCQNIHAPNVDTEFGLTRIISLDLQAQTVRENLLLSNVEAIYASKDSLYLTTPYDWWDYKSRDVDFTYIHKFDLKSPGLATYRGSGGVEGRLINQFAMDEYENHLRVATTVQRYCRHQEDEEDVEFDLALTKSATRSGNLALQQTSTATSPAPNSVCPPRDQMLYNQVTTLAELDGKLVEVGKTPAIAPSERIYSVRFAGARGFVVTFRRVDPLFTLDLADPKRPAVVGELKIPGYSTYIHMVDEKTLLTIGRDASEQGQTRGIKLSIFDVSDMTKPKELHSLALKDRFWSEAETNHKAFNFYREKNLLAIPVTGHRTVATTDVWWGEYLSTLKIFKIDRADGIREFGELGMSDIYNSSALRDEDWWFSAAAVKRSIFADNFVYAVTDLGLRTANLDTLDQPLATVRFECDRVCYEEWRSW